MWERCRPPMAIVIIGIKGDKEGQTTGWNKSGLNNKCKSISWLSDCYHLFKVFLRPSFGAYAPPSPDLTFYAYALLRRVGRLSSIVFPSEDLSRRSRATLPEGESFLSRHLRATLPEGESSYRHCVPLSPKGKAFLYIPKGKVFLYIMLIHILFCFVLFCSAIHFMDIVIWISFSLLYKTASKFFHVKFFIVPLKLLDTLHKHGYNVQCKIVWCRLRVLKIHRIGLQGFKPQSKISKEKYFSFRLWRKDSPKWGN